MVPRLGRVRALQQLLNAHFVRVGDRAAAIDVVQQQVRRVLALEHVRNPGVVVAVNLIVGVRISRQKSELDTIPGVLAHDLIACSFKVGIGPDHGPMAGDDLMVKSDRESNLFRRVCFQSARLPNSTAQFKYHDYQQCNVTPSKPNLIGTNARLGSLRPVFIVPNTL